MTSEIWFWSLLGAYAFGAVSHYYLGKAVQRDRTAREPDAGCVTMPDGSCEGVDCMHARPAPPMPTVWVRNEWGAPPDGLAPSDVVTVRLPCGMTLTGEVAAFDWTLRQWEGDIVAWRRGPLPDAVARVLPVAAVCGDDDLSAIVPARTGEGA